MVVGPGRGGSGGIAVVIETLVSSALAKRFRLTVISTHRDGTRARKLLRAMAGIARAGALLATRRVDVVQLHTSSGPSLRRKAAVAALARCVRRPYVVHVHAGDFDAYYERAPGWERRLIRSTLRRAALVVALSPGWERALLAITNCSTTVIPNAVPIPTQAAEPSLPPRIVTLGKLGDGKGSRVLVQALAALDERHGEARLVLAGHGDRAPVLAEARRLGVEQRVELPGWIGPDERHRTLAGATIFALPSREEGMPVALLEAMAYGLPVVATPVGSVPDVVSEGRSGFLVPPDDVQALAQRLHALLDDPAAARRMGAEGRRQMRERHDIHVVAAQVGNALDAVLRRGS
jgi:glycosyltransferase involved in cell wall biosynthesis